MNAINYAGLVGKYIRMERPAAVDELIDQSDIIGMECTVMAVIDRLHDAVDIVSDDGMAFRVSPGEPWAFTVWPDETTRLGSNLW